MSGPDPKELAVLASAVALEAGKFLRASQSSSAANITTKSSLVDMVSDVDRASETLIVERILDLRPADAILGEEHGTRSGTSGVRWLIDPLDGTTNYLYGIPAYAVSIAAEFNGQPVAGAVYDVSRDELFLAGAGLGATCNGLPLSVNVKENLASSLVGTGFGYETAQRMQQGLVAAEILGQVRDIRRFGSAALDLCWVAAGRLDAYYDRALQPWDRAAGALMVSEAGGSVSASDDGMWVFASLGIANALRTVVTEAEVLHPVS